MRMRAALIVLAALLGGAARLPAQQYERPPEVLLDIVSRSAADVDSALSRGADPQAAAEELDAVWDRLVFYTVADALPGGELHEIRGLRAYRYLAEVGRTDKQVGAPPGGPASTALTVRPGFAELLAFALEHGAVEQSTNGTGVTLSTSPYAFVRLIRPDNAENWSRYGFWRRIGAAATFDTRTEGPDAGTIDETKQLAHWSLRLRVLGDRSTRAAWFTERWQERIQPRIQERLDALTAGVSTTIDGTPALRAAAESAGARARSDLAAYLTDHASTPAAERVAAMTGIVLDALYRGVFEPIRTGTIVPGDGGESVRASVSRLGAAHRALVESEADLGGLLEALDRSLLLTLEYGHHARVGPLSGFSDLRLLFENEVAPFNVVANGFLSLYDDPDEAIGQEKVRDYGVSLAIEGEVAGPFSRRLPQNLSEPVTLSVEYQLSRLVEGEEMVHVAQARANIPISPGVALPLSITYASRAAQVDEEHVRGNFGLSLDLDKFYAMAQALAGR